MGPYGPADPTGGTAGRVHVPPQEDIPSSSAWDGSAAPASLVAPPPSQTAVVAQPNAHTGATGYPADAPAIAVLLMLRVPPSFASKSELPVRKRARVEFVAFKWEVDVEMQAGEQTPPPPPHFIPLHGHHGVGGAVQGGGAARGAVRIPVARGGRGLESGDGGSGEARGG